MKSKVSYKYSGLSFFGNAVIFVCWEKCAKDFAIFVHVEVVFFWSGEVVLYMMETMVCMCIRILIVMDY